MADTKHINGLDFFGALTLLLIGLKLTAVIDWAWWLVLMPLWWRIAVFAAASFALLVVGGLDKLVAVMREAWRARHD